MIAGGFLIDFFTLDIMFYAGSVILFVSGLLLLRASEPAREHQGNERRP